MMLIIYMFAKMQDQVNQGAVVQGEEELFSSNTKETFSQMSYNGMARNESI